MPEPELIKRFKELSPECSSYIDLFMNNLDEVVDMFPGADMWLKDLKSRGYNIYLLSNYPRRLFALHTPRFHFLHTGNIKQANPTNRRNSTNG
jgi:putative hydrolase of the HAD superfamily